MTAQLKWHNVNLAIRVKVSTGAAYLIAIFVAILYAIVSKWVKPMADNFLGGEAAVWAITATYLTQQHGSNKLDAEVAKAGAGGQLNEIKMAAAGVKIPCGETKP